MHGQEREQHQSRRQLLILSHLQTKEKLLGQRMLPPSETSTAHKNVIVISPVERHSDQSVLQRAAEPTPVVCASRLPRSAQTQQERLPLDRDTGTDKHPQPFILSLWLELGVVTSLERPSWNNEHFDNVLDL